MELIIPTKTLAAAIHCAATKAVRYYLNGVHVRVDESQGVFVESTDGSVAFQDQLSDLAPDDTKGPFGIIIPLAAVKTATKTKAPALCLKSLPDGRYSLGDVLFTAVDGKFPDVDRVMPRRDDENYNGPLPVFDAELLLRAQKALQTAMATKNVFAMWPNPANKSSSATFLMAPMSQTFPRCVVSPCTRSKSA